MELDNIEKLVKKYLEANTSIAEEETLKAYFTQKKVASHLEHYTPMFEYFSKAKQEKYTKEIVLPKKAAVKNYKKYIAIAASVAALLGAYFGPSGYEKYKEQKDAEYAYHQTKKALNLLSKNFSKGTDKVAYLNEFVLAKKKIYNND